MPMDAILALGSNGKPASRASQEFAPGLRCSGEIPRCAGMQPSDPMLFRDAAATIPDPLLDDQALIIDTVAGLVVISGCCHAGIDPTLVHARRLHPGRPVLALVGGLHLGACDDVERRRHLDHLATHGPAQIIAGHCTGSDAEALLEQDARCHFSPLRCGQIWHLVQDRLQCLAPESAAQERL
jgi:7,8-dihydropterin-6-yl-methyl-4-(beta-D-ribofuranosyl)aminobenzene 5'-phosphate synthase